MKSQHAYTPGTGLDSSDFSCENLAMSATAIGEKRQTTLPKDVSEAAGLEPGDQVDWRFEDGEIRGRKLTEPRTIMARLVISDGHLVADTTGLTIDPEDIAKAVREEREAQASRGVQPHRGNR
jgi:bifunctional DNA-binding transcriptional regulator/antitoxin component of YhaV-PrlF toxin-antitoxin module